jgi:hypothetical protein
MITFKPYKEQGYYNQKTYIKSNERKFDVMNKNRLSYYIFGNAVYVYYLGRYYKGIMLANMEEIDLINSILSQCSDPHKVKEIEEENIEVD